jgi:hypothetical protein
MQEVRRRKALGNHVRGFLHLQSELQRVRIVQPAPYHHGVMHEAVTLRNSRDLTFERQSVRGNIRNGLQFRDTNFRAQRICQKVKNHQLAGIRLGRSNTFLTPRAHKEYVFGDSGQTASRLIRDTHGEVAGFSRLLQYLAGICRFPGLRERNHKCVFVKARPAIRGCRL